MSTIFIGMCARFARFIFKFQEHVTNLEAKATELNVVKNNLENAKNEVAFQTKEVQDRNEKLETRDQVSLELEASFFVFCYMFSAVNMRMYAIQSCDQANK